MGGKRPPCPSAMPRRGSHPAKGTRPRLRSAPRRHRCNPARPDKPELLSPREVPKRKPGTEAGRIALLHAVAHIELNAVDLHWDIIARFGHVPMPIGFYDDWVKCAEEESRHFEMVCDCLESMGSHYGALPAHAGMWRAAEDTAEDLMGRLAVVPMVLEARGLDVTPGMIDIFRKAEGRKGHRRAGSHLRRRGRPCGLWLEMVPFPVRARKRRPQGCVSPAGAALLPRGAETTLSTRKNAPKPGCRLTSTGR